ncbi:MAG: RHS repeat-associated core domain-containing protein, partial [Dietzia sp.]|nr:RHS repeat-associated core domain-containing protein [Dietzia sp.]
LPARYYDPATYRFLRVDPAPPSAGDPGSLNAFVYCGDDPIQNIDPDGRELMGYMVNLYAKKLGWDRAYALAGCQRVRGWDYSPRRLDALGARLRDRKVRRLPTIGPASHFQNVKDRMIEDWVDFGAPPDYVGVGGTLSAAYGPRVGYSRGFITDGSTSAKTNTVITGVGSPSASASVYVAAGYFRPGTTSIRGMGRLTSEYGGSVGEGFGVGLDYQRSTDSIDFQSDGIAVNAGFGVRSLPGWEVHRDGGGGNSEY